MTEEYVRPTASSIDADLPEADDVWRSFELPRLLPTPITVALAAFLFAAAVVAQVVAIGQDEALLIPYALSVLLLAVRFGERVGVAAALVAFGAFAAIQELVDDQGGFSHGWSVYVMAGVALVAIAWALGRGTHRLVESEERFRTSVESLLEPFGIYRSVRDAHGEIIDFVIEYINPAAAEATGVSRRDQIGRRLLELYPGRLESGLFDEYKRVVETGEPFFKDAVTTQDLFGEQVILRAFDMRATKLGDGFAAAWRDITERKTFERELRESEERLTTIVSNLPMAVTMQDVELKFVWVVEPRMGLSSDEVIGKTDADFLAPEDVDRIVALKRTVLETGKPANYIVSVPRGDQKYWFEGTVTRIADSEGRVGGLVVTSIDVTDRMRADEERRWASITADGASDAVIGVSRDWTIQSWNNGASLIFGYERVEAIGRPITILKPSAEPGELTAAMEAAVAGLASTGTRACELVTSTGAPCIVNASFSPVRSEDGDVIGVAVVARRAEV